MDENKNTVNKDAVVEGFTPEWFSDTLANDGGGFSRHPIGDYRGRVSSFAIQPSKTTSPHNMMAITIETIALAGSGAEDAVGMTQLALYGTPQSPRFMQQRAQCFLTAIGIRGAFRPREILGRELDFTVSWEKSAPTVSEVSGEETTYINSRISFERKAGSPKPPKSNAKVASVAAINYLKARGEYDEGGPNGDDAAGEPAAYEGRPGATAGAGDAAKAPQGEAQWLAEDQVNTASVHQYRATIALGKPQAEAARKALTDRKINPSGPVNVEYLAAPLRAEYEAWKAKSSDGALPPLDGLDAPAKPARTGTRVNKQPAA